MKKIIVPIIFIFLMVHYNGTILASSTQSRIDKDIASGKSIVIQLLVALADNRYQSIVPIPAAIGDGQNAATNLYWGARYGVKTFMTRDAGWKKVAIIKVSDNRILQRIVMKKNFVRNKQPLVVYLIADAWDGRYINATIKQFMQFNHGIGRTKINVDGKQLLAGSRAHLIAYIGHNALMDYSSGTKNLFSNSTQGLDNPINDTIVLACKSQSYFSVHLKQTLAHPILLTTGLMAPEAYSLNAAITQWIKGSTDTQIRKAAAKSYHHYQKTGIKAAERLFGVK